MSMDRRADLVGSITMAVLGIGVILYGLGYPPPRNQYDLFGPMGVPMIIGLGLVVGGLFQSVRTWQLLREFGSKAFPEGSEDEPGHPASSHRAVAFMAGSMVYLFSLPYLGYLVATPVAIAAGLWSLNFRNPVKLVVTAVGFTVVGFALFNNLLSVPVPVGVLNDLLVSLGLIDRVR